jgi:hypothetical protein
MLNVVNQFAEKHEVLFSEDKSNYLVFRGETSGEPLKIGNIKIDRRNSYKYLGINLVTEENYLKEQEAVILKRTGRYLGIIKSKAAFSYNRYEVSRILWKGVAVPGLTYADDALVMGRDTRILLERAQKQMGRFALGVNKYTADEAVQGEMGWSSFQGREAIAKLLYFGRILNMDGERYAKKIYVFNRIQAPRTGNTKWFRRVAFLSRTYLGEELRPGGFGCMGRGWEGKARREIKERALQIWAKGVEGKSSLKKSYWRKELIKREGFMDNRRGSSLLVQARAGSLWTNHLRSKFSEVEDKCSLCGEEGDSIEHIVMHCEGLSDKRGGWRWPNEVSNWGDKEQLDYVLGFYIEGVVMENHELENTKRLLEAWEERTKTTP